MSIMRHPHYVWTDGTSMHLDDVAMVLPAFDAVVLARAAQLAADPDALAAAVAAIEDQRGNFGVWAWDRANGRDPAAELDAFIAQAVATREDAAPPAG